MKRQESLLAKIGRYSDTIESLIASVAFVLMCIFVLTTIVFRFILQHPISWAEEAARYSMITGIFVAMPLAVRGHVHLGVDIFINLLPKSMKRLALIFSDTVTLIAYLAIDYACYSFVMRALRGSQTSPAMHIPIVWMYIVILVGFVLATIAQLSNMVEEHKEHILEMAKEADA
ncbi:TRAP transporter small permease [uncultured Cloacibacillus sp.]|uniref:TRAP transporter small permease n=1 Tax=uncultured Cloacibacillus sp. TaxID=889794 RepID=UPI001F8FCCC8|nr:TRAP transporter small permease [uncultured Cloacibacillus sp.]HIR16986.1 TRAP transporter small permease [Candidatus Caccocola faecigallinarum]